MHTNIQDTFDYSMEESKKGFQAGISSLLELQGHLQAKQLKALQNKKDGIWFTNEELRTLSAWIMDLAGSQMGHYLVLDGTIRKTNKLFKCALKIQDREQNTPNLKKLLA